jgi:hypothetical protein
MRILADSALDLRMNAPYWVDERASICGSALIHFDSIAGLLQFHTSCQNSRNIWIQTIDFVDWDLVVPEELRNENPPWDRVKADAPEVINIDIKVHCNCPAFLWWGSWWNVDDRGSALFSEGIPAPNIRDPQRNNVICKHLAAVFNQHF